MSVRYNFLTLAKIIGFVLITAFVLFVLYWLGIGAWELMKLVWAGVCWVAAALWSGLCWLFSKWLWLLGIALLALLGWILSKVKWPELKASKSDKKRSWNWLWALLLLLLLLLGLLWLFKSCDNSSEEPQAYGVTVEQFDEAFDWVVTTRAYLDGVQDGTTKTEVALVGLKFVDGQPVTKMTFEGRTYEEAVAIIAKDWRQLVTSNVHVPLTKQQLVTMILFAMRNGKYGFEKSDFLRNVNNGNLSSDAMALHKANGERRYLQTEGLQYLWMLKNLWDGKISMQELVDCPMFSYKAIRLDEMYDYDRKPVFTDVMNKRLHLGNYPTPRQALDI